MKMAGTDKVSTLSSLRQIRASDAAAETPGLAFEDIHRYRLN